MAVQKQNVSLDQQDQQHRQQDQQQDQQQQQLAKKLSLPSLKAFCAICDKWQLSIDEASDLMGSPPRHLFAQWFSHRENVMLDNIQIKRISYLLAIFNALKTYLPNEMSSLVWIRRPNTESLFEGKSPLSQMRKGELGFLNELLKFIA